MNIKPNRILFILTMIFLLMLTTGIVCANESNETFNSHTTEILNVDGETTNHFDGKELYVNHNVESSGNGSEELPYKTIKEAIDIANTGKNPVTIHIHAGTYNETNMTITNSLVIKSYDGNAILNANKTGWFFYSENSDNYLSLHGLTFINGIRYDEMDSTVGGVVKTEGHIDVVNCTFENNFGGTGGGINSHNGANIINSTFRNNKAEYNGAGVYVIYGKTNIVNCTFTNNSVKNQGGAIRIQGDTYIENTIFTNNTAKNRNYNGRGGAGLVTDGNLTIESSTFEGNYAEYSGGAIEHGDNSQYSNTHYSFNINNSTFNNNQARSGAGIIANDGLNMTDSVVSNNHVQSTSVSKYYGNGPGIYVLHGNSILTGNTIKNNTNPYNSGATDIFTYEGTVAENNNDWGSSSNSRISTVYGKQTNDITKEPTITKPQITIQTGEQRKNKQTNAPASGGSETHNPTTEPQKENSENNTPGNPTEPQKENSESDSPGNPTEPHHANTINENVVGYDSNQTINTIKDQNPSTNSKNIDKTNSVVKTNSSTEFESNNDIGESTQDGTSSESSTSNVHEISPAKSIVSTNEYKIPGIIIVLIALLALIIGYLRKREDD